MKKLTSLLLTLPLAFSLSCHAPKEESLRGVIKVESEYPLDNKFDFKITDYQNNHPKKVLGIGATTGQYIVKVGEEFYDIQLLSRNKEERDSIINTFNQGDSIEFKNKYTFPSGLYFLESKETLSTKQGYWQFDEVKKIK